MKQNINPIEFDRRLTAGSLQGTTDRLLCVLDSHYPEVRRTSTRRYRLRLFCLAVAVAVLTTLLALPSALDYVFLSPGADRGAMLALTQQMVEVL